MNRGGLQEELIQRNPLVKITILLGSAGPPMLKIGLTVRECIGHYLAPVWHEKMDEFIVS